MILSLSIRFIPEANHEYCNRLTVQTTSCLFTNCLTESFGCILLYRRSTHILENKNTFQAISLLVPRVTNINFLLMIPVQYSTEKVMIIKKMITKQRENVLIQHQNLTNSIPRKCMEFTTWRIFMLILRLKGIYPKL